MEGSPSNQYSLGQLHYQRQLIIMWEVCLRKGLRSLTEQANLKEDKAGGRDWRSAFIARVPPPAQCKAVDRQQLSEWPCIDPYLSYTDRVGAREGRGEGWGGWGEKDQQQQVETAMVDC